MEYDPSAVAAAPILVPVTTTFAPARASPVEASVTVPETVFCANKKIGRKAMNRTCENFLMSLSLIVFDLN